MSLHVDGYVQNLCKFSSYFNVFINDGLDSGPYFQSVLVGQNTGYYW